MSELVFRMPVPADGLALNRLIERCPPLDTNSVYCNLLQCTHFADTAIVAERDGELVGSVSGYRPPDQADTLFVWQVALDPSCRGQGVARQMLTLLFERLRLQGVCALETTISPGNRASERLFTSFFEALRMPYTCETLYHRDHHFGGQHDDEVLYRAVSA